MILAAPDVFFVRVGDGLQAADAAAHHDAVAGRSLAFNATDASIPQSLRCGHDAVLHERVHAARVLCGHVLVEVQPLNFTRETRREIGGVEALDGSDAAAAVQHVVPGGIHLTTDGRNNTETGDDDSAPGRRMGHEDLRVSGR
jgi:hypothetical protein